MRCRSCSASLRDSDLICPRCGAEQAVSELPTGTAPRPSPVRAGPPRTPGRSPSPRTPAPGGRTSAVAGGRFVPGALLAERFRIVGLLGRGGMGEVYRADDLKLDQQVALKFLPEALQEDPERLNRFYGEVRLARQISHPSICRVYDVVEADGTPFLSMEYVDGEDLASLLRRIGRLPPDKALEIARQLCAGLAAAHEKGVLHRDLKPENVMVDGRGHVRITDFGLAVGADSVDAADVRSGTPGYMSPEQLAGLEVTLRSDVYALGLVLYELFTGRKAVEAATRGELERKHREEAPTPPSELVPELDPAVERAILHCLEKEPRHRPPSAVSVAAALPGGDPLAAALAAGETPSPELVAAAGSQAGLHPPLAWALLGGIVLALPLIAWLWTPVTLQQIVGMEKTPDVLEDRAHELLRRLGYAQQPADRARGYDVDLDYVQEVLQKDQSPTRWDSLATGPAVLQFWYRQSPRSLLAQGPLGRVLWDDPPLLESGMAGVQLDTHGRLLQLLVVPPQLEAPPEAKPGAPDWDLLFADAGLVRARFQPTEPGWTPPFFADARAAWVGTHPQQTDVPLRVEAAAYRGQPVYFRVLPPWARADRATPFQWTRSQRTAQVIMIGVLLGIVVAATLLARRHLRLGRGDRAGAHRLAGHMTFMGTVIWALNADHVFDLGGELGLVLRGLGLALVLGALMFVLYLALEPFVRRRWPQTLVAWTRVLAGRWNDPLVGRDILLGTAAAVLMMLMIGVARRMPLWLGQAAPLPHAPGIGTALGPPQIVSNLLSQQIDATALSLAVLLLLTFLRHLTGRTWAALAIVLAILSTPAALMGLAPSVVAVPMSVLTNLVVGLVLVRFGLFACVVNVFVLNALMELPITMDLSSWTARPTFWLAGLVIGLAVYGFRTALPGQDLTASRPSGPA